MHCLSGHFLVTRGCCIETVFGRDPHKLHLGAHTGFGEKLL